METVGRWDGAKCPL